MRNISRVILIGETIKNMFEIITYPNPMKLAHLILAHKDPELLERLVRTLRHENADIFIQLDKKSNIDDFKYIENIGNTRFISDRVDIGWCCYSTIDATLKGFEEILLLKNNYSHINLLSGQDYPLKPIEFIQQHFFSNRATTFIHSASIADNEWDDGRARFTKYSFGDFNIPGKYKLQAIVNAILPARKLPAGLKPYGRSQWLTITPVCAQYVINYLKNNPRVKRYFKTVWAVDEVFFQTILVNSPYKYTLVNYNLRYIELDTGQRPINYTMADADKLATTDALFARKFDNAVSAEVLDYVDSLIAAPVKVRYAQ